MLLIIYFMLFLASPSRLARKWLRPMKNWTFLKIIYWSLCTRVKSRKPGMSRKGKCTVSLHCIEDVAVPTLRNKAVVLKDETPQGEQTD